MGEEGLLRSDSNRVSDDKFGNVSKLIKLNMNLKAVDKNKLS
jgi:hypothetical protein